MGIISEIKKLKASDVMMAVLAFSAVIAPGFLTLYLFKPNLIADIDIVKLIVFSVALTIPQCALSLFGLIFYRDITKKPDLKDEETTTIFLWVMLWTFLVFYVSLLIAYFYGITFKYFLLTLAVANVLVPLCAYILSRFFDNET